MKIPPCHREESVVTNLAHDDEKSQKNTNILFLHIPFCYAEFQEGLYTAYTK